MIWNRELLKVDLRKLKKNYSWKNFRSHKNKFKLRNILQHKDDHFRQWKSWFIVPRGAEDAKKHQQALNDIRDFLIFFSTQHYFAYLFAILLPIHE